MPWVTLIEQPSYEHSHSLTVRATDINYAGHLGNEALLGLVHETRSHFLKALQFKTILGDTQQIGLAIADLVVNFKAEAFAHDPVVVDSQIGDMTEKSFRLFHRIRCEEQVIALVETGVVAYDYQSGQAVPLPESFLSELIIFRSR